MKKAWIVLLTGLISAAAAVGVLYSRFRRPCRETVEESSLPPALVYAVMKAESGFDQNAVSAAGAVGLMQLLPSTAMFVAERSGVAFAPEKLFEAEYNVKLGCLYLEYLLERFPKEGTAIAAYNAGEGTVDDWLRAPSFSEDGETLGRIPYPETEDYVKKVVKFRKIYEILY